MRLVTGATARSNIANLYTESSWQSFMDRRDRTMLIMLFKIKNHEAPDYLCELLPPENQEYIRYNLRNNTNIKVPYTRLETFKRSFFPYSIRLWNSLSKKTRASSCLSDFKQALKQKDREVNVLYYYGERWAQVHHSRLRMGCSKLKADLFYKLHVIDNCICACGYHIENASHYFLSCPQYHDIRQDLIATITNITRINIKTILFGDNLLQPVENKIIFDAVPKFIKLPQRFN